MDIKEREKGIDSSWEAVKNLLAKASNVYEVIAYDNRLDVDESLLLLEQYDSSLKAVFSKTGGILIDNGWIRIYGSGTDYNTKNLISWNVGKAFDEGDSQPGYLIVGDDIIGGMFAVNNDSLGDDKGFVYYLSPDTIEWEPIFKNYEDFLSFCLNADLEEFYEEVRWDNWQKDVQKLKFDESIFIIPPLWLGGPDDVNHRNRTTVSSEELYNALYEASIILQGEYADGFDGELSGGGCCSSGSCGGCPSKAKATTNSGCGGCSGCGCA